MRVRARERGTVLRVACCVRVSVHVCGRVHARWRTWTHAQQQTTLTVRIRRCEIKQHDGASGSDFCMRVGVCGNMRASVDERG